MFSDVTSCSSVDASVSEDTIAAIFRVESNLMSTKLYSVT
jgi:hypothetical protein